LLRPSTVTNGYCDVSILTIACWLGRFYFRHENTRARLTRFKHSPAAQSITSPHSPLHGVLVGTISTAFLQSNSLVSLFVLAFVGSGILPLHNALGIIFGANLGTTLTGWLVSAIGFKLHMSDYALILIALGSLAYATFKNESSRYHQASLIFGLGLLLLGLTWMKDSMSFLGAQVDENWFRDYPLVIYFISITLGIDNTMYALACFHSLFNLLGIVLFLPLTKPFAHWLEQRFTSTSALGCSHINLVPPIVPEAALHAIAQDARELILKAL
jgi:Na+/phosphate symporter